MAVIDAVYKADDWLIDKIFQPIAWRVEYYTGWNNYWCARAVLVVWPAATFAVEPVHPSGWVVKILILLVASVLYLRTILIEKMQRPALASSFRIHGRSGRILGFPLLFLPPILSLFNLGWLGYMFHLYFLACSPMPPKWQEEKELKTQRLAAHSAFGT